MGCLVLSRFTWYISVDPLHSVGGLILRVRVHDYLISAYQKDISLNFPCKIRKLVLF